MKFIGNLIWFFTFGLVLSVLHFLLGIALCASIILIPFGVQHIKIAGYTIKPFGRSADPDFDRYPMANLIWAIFGGFLFSLVYILIGAVLCVTIVGIPFAKKLFNLAGMVFVPFGAVIS